MSIHGMPCIFECRLINELGIEVQKIEMIERNRTDVLRKLKKRFFPENNSKWEITSKRRLTKDELPHYWSVD